MNPTTTWLIAFALLLGAEMLTGTFYLLAIACGSLLGALLAWLGSPTNMQLLAAAFGAALAVLALQRWKTRQQAMPTQQDDDIGQPVRIVQWQDDQHARVQYRGTLWDAELAPGESSNHGTGWQIVAKHGSRLLIHATRPVDSDS